MISNQIIISSFDSISKQIQSSQNSLWLGTLSFEERCYGSLILFAKYNLRLNSGLIVDYQTNIRPLIDAKRKREFNWNRLEHIGEKVFVEGIVREKLAAHTFQALENLLEKIFHNSSIDSIVIDISCFTKIHALTIASVMARLKNSVRWFIAYTTPENYGFVSDIKHNLPAWKDIIIAPLAETALLFNEASGRGIIVPGHEADRLIVALGEIEPSGGVILLTDTKDRPDLRYITQRRNQKIIKQLVRRQASDWHKYIIPFVSLLELERHIQHEIELARKFKAPIILFPYGPKAMVFAIAYQLTMEYPESSWFVYPIPSIYDVYYSFGIEQTLWLSGGYGVKSMKDR